MKKLPQSVVPLIVFSVVILTLILLPTSFEDAIIYKDAIKARAEVIETNESSIINTGLIRSGQQICKVEFKSGKFKGKEGVGVNLLTGSLSTDKLYSVGEHVLTVVHHNGDELLSVLLVDHYRLNGELILIIAFVCFLVFFAGRTGINAIISFVLTILCLWKILVPLYLKGINPILAGLAISVFLTISIISLVYGFDKRCLSASSGAILGIITTCLIGIIYTKSFNIHGAIMDRSESLLYSGYNHLNLTQIFMAGIFIGASGAMMDLSVDITSAVQEVIYHKPNISAKEAVNSGMNVARAAMGTMTTTLLLAYSGGSIALLMVFMAQGTPLLNVLNYKYVAAEIIDTIVGSFGLVTVGPFTAIMSGLLLTKKGREEIV